MGNGVATVVIGKLTGDLDAERMKKVLDNDASVLTDDPEEVLDGESAKMNVRS